MSQPTHLKDSYGCHYLKGAVVALMLAMTPGIATAQIIWSGDYETGDFLQWHQQSDPEKTNYSQMPAYGRPAPYGDGSLLEIVTSPVRQGRYAAKVTVKNSAYGVEPDDCDIPFPKCSRRRTELAVQATLPLYYDAIPYMSERWMSVSYYVPSDWDSGGSGWGPTVFQVKPLIESSGSISPTFSIEINNGVWMIFHRWDEAVNPASSQVTWQQQMFYTGDEGGSPYPRADFWPDGLADFPDVEDSHAALQSLNKGGWTDWVIHVKIDARGAGNGGNGFLSVWKREDSGPWIHVLYVLPKLTTRGGVTFDHGIFYNSPASGSSPGGFGIKAGMYLTKDQVWDLRANRVLYNDNIKVGSEAATFATMSPDGSSPGANAPIPESRPNPPAFLAFE